MTEIKMNLNFIIKLFTIQHSTILMGHMNIFELEYYIEKLIEDGDWETFGRMMDSETITRTDAYHIFIRTMPTQLDAVGFDQAFFDKYFKGLPLTPCDIRVLVEADNLDLMTIILKTSEVTTISPENHHFDQNVNETLVFFLKWVFNMNDKEQINTFLYKNHPVSRYWSSHTDNIVGQGKLLVK